LSVSCSAEAAVYRLTDTGQKFVPNGGSPFLLRQDPTRTSHALRSNAVSRMSRQLGAATFASEMGWLAREHSR